MVGIARLLQLTLWVAAVDAFFPWIPEDCGGDDCDGLKLGGKRGVEGHTQVKGITLELLQRVPSV